VVVLPDPVGPGDDHDTAGPGQRPVDEALEYLRVHPDARDVDQVALAVQKAQHDGLAVDGHIEGGAHVQLAARIFEQDAAALVATLLGDVRLAHDLDAA